MWIFEFFNKKLKIFILKLQKNEEFEIEELDKSIRFQIDLPQDQD
jgi:hypothetical protein